LSSYQNNLSQTECLLVTIQRSLPLITSHVMHRIFSCIYVVVCEVTQAREILCQRHNLRPPCI